MYFDDPSAARSSSSSSRVQGKYKRYPPYECDHAYFNIESSSRRRKPMPPREMASKAEVVKALEGRGPVALRHALVAAGPRPDVQLLTRASRPQNQLRLCHDQSIEVVSTKSAMKPSGAKLLEWINGWKI